MSDRSPSRRAILTGIAALATSIAGCAGRADKPTTTAATPATTTSTDATTGRATATPTSPSGHGSAAESLLPTSANRPGETLGRVHEYRPRRLAGPDGQAPVAVSTEFLDSAVRLRRYTRSPITLPGVRRRDLNVILTNPGGQGLSVYSGGGVADAMRNSLPDAVSRAGTTRGFDVYVGPFAVVAVGERTVVAYVQTYEAEYKRSVVDSVAATHGTTTGFGTTSSAAAAFETLGDPVLANVPTRLTTPVDAGANPSPKRAAFDGSTGVFGSLCVDGETAVSRGTVLYDESVTVPESALRTWLGLTEDTTRPAELSRYSTVELAVDGRTATLVARRPRADATTADVQPLPM